MKVYLHDNKPGDSRLPQDSGTPYQLEKIAATRGYTNRDELGVSPETIGPAFEALCKKFFMEHLHQDEEVRYFLKGVGYFDVRNAKDERVRIKAEAGDLLVLPAGIYHRFTLDEANYGGVLRLFEDHPKWEALNRSAETDQDEYRKNYLLARSNGSFLV
ncbi:hypothetical protein EAF00_000575 [Botryotinia globosa]|nr:hypothetical protein EAF00_000575 [Botryotinia globosa]